MTTEEPPGMTPPSLTVVFDTNVVVTLVIQASRATRLFSRLRAAGHRVAVSPQILAEAGEMMRTRAGLRKWLRLTDGEIEQFLGTLPSLMHLTDGLVVAAGAVPADPDDDVI